MRTTSAQSIIYGHRTTIFVKMTGLTAVHRTTEIMMNTANGLDAGATKVTKAKQNYNKKPPANL